MRGRLRWWGLGIGAVGGVLDTWLMWSLGVEFRVAGANMTAWVAVYLACNFAALCFAIGHFADARARARSDAETIRHQLRALEATQRIAIQNEKLAAVGRVAAGVAHEVRNPLGVIRASASMVQESFDRDDEAHRACQFICEEIDRLNALITALLTFSRPAEPRLRQTSVEKIVDRAVHLASDELARRRIDLFRESAGPAPEVQADPDLLSQVVFGLVTNAAEAVDRDGRVAVRCEGDAGGVRIEVADSGPGVAPGDASHVFEPFFTTKPTGTGLGLAMTARIVEAHGGRIAVLHGRGAGEGGAGACFRIELPCEPPGDSA